MVSTTKDNGYGEAAIMTIPASTESLARLVLRTLEAQQRYFSTRSRFDLIQSKSLEKQLHAAAAAIVGPDVEPEVKAGPGRPVGDTPSDGPRTSDG